MQYFCVSYSERQKNALEERVTRVIQIQILDCMIQPIFLSPVMIKTYIDVISQVIFKVFYFEQVPHKIGL